MTINSEILITFVLFLSSWNRLGLISDLRWLCAAGKMAGVLWHRSLPLTVIFSLILSSIRAELFTAVVELENLVYREREMRFELERYLSLEQERLSKLKMFLTKVNAAHELVGDDVSRYLGHPVNSYLEIRRFYKEWPEVERLIQLDNSEGKIYLM